jgi:hypothetical protein
MTTLSTLVSLLAISVAFTVSGDAVFAKTGGGPGHVKTSGASATRSGVAAIKSKTRVCHYHHCVTVPRSGTTTGGGGNPINRGPGHPALHPK